MKRTTYILMGLLAAGLIVIVATIVTLHVSKGETLENSIVLGLDRGEMNLNSIRVLKMIMAQPEGWEDEKILVIGQFTITSSDSVSNGISYPKSKYVSINQRRDTLFVKVDVNAYNVPATLLKNGSFFVDGLNIQLSADSLTSIISDISGIGLHLRQAKADSLSIHANCQVLTLDSCQFRSLDIASSGMSLEVKGSKIDHFYLDLDGVWDWTFHSSTVQTLYLTGSNHHHSEIQKGGCSRTIWTPKNKDAVLQIMMREKATVDILSE